MFSNMRASEGTRDYDSQSSCACQTPFLCRSGLRITVDTLKEFFELTNMCAKKAAARRHEGSFVGDDKVMDQSVIRRNRGTDVPST